MKNSKIYFLVNILLLSLLTLNSCKKDKPNESNNPLENNLSPFVIGGLSFDENFKTGISIKSQYSHDSNNAVHYFDSSTTFMTNFRIYENKTIINLYAPNYSHIVNFQINGDNIIYDHLSDYNLRTQSVNKDTIRFTNRNSSLQNFADTVSLTYRVNRIPKLYSMGDTVNWDKDYLIEGSDGTLLQYYREINQSDSVVEDTEISIMDVVNSNPKFVVFKYQSYPNGNITENLISKFGLVELSINADTTLTIHNVYTQE